MTLWYYISIEWSYDDIMILWCYIRIEWYYNIIIFVCCGSTQY